MGTAVNGTNARAACKGGMRGCAQAVGFRTVSCFSVCFSSQRLFYFVVFAPTVPYQAQ